MDEDEDRSSVRSSVRENSSEQHNSEPLFKFRNYKPETHFIDGLFCLESSQPESIKHLIQDKLEIVSTENSGYRIDPKLMEPKKADWDLKRRIERRLDMLDRATRKSIAKHIREIKKRR